jgi:hypothetical protein
MATTGSGGARRGAGRPKKSTSVVLVNAKAALAPLAKARLTERLMDKVMGMNITPLEVMLNTMKLHYDSAQSALLAHEVADGVDQRRAFMREAKAEMNASSQVAEKVAPYLHPKLQAVTLKGDSDHPLNLSGSLRGLSDSELVIMEALLSKATPTGQ